MKFKRKDLLLAALAVEKFRDARALEPVYRFDKKRNRRVVENHRALPGRFVGVYQDGDYNLKRFGVEEGGAREVLRCEFSRTRRS